MVNKKYYWLKLKRDFFKRHDIRIVEELPNGKEYLLFYLKLLVESIDHEGALRFSDTVPYNEQMLSVITNTNIDIVRAAMKLFTELKMMEVLDDATIYMAEVSTMIGSAVDNDGANRVRRFREKQKQVALPGVTGALQNVTQSVTKDNESKSIEKDIEQDIDLENKRVKEKTDFQSVVDLYHQICISFPSVRSLSDARKKAIKARLKTYSLEDFKTVFENAEASSFLKGKNDRNWSANFDWLIADKNMAKVLEGNYADKGRKEIVPAWFEKSGYYHGPRQIDEDERRAIQRVMADDSLGKDIMAKTINNNPELAERAEKLKERLGG